MPKPQSGDIVYIYFIAAGQHIKIGYTDTKLDEQSGQLVAEHWHVRLKAIQQGIAYKVVPLLVVHGEKQTEGTLKRLFKEHLERHEWHRSDPELLDHLMLRAIGDAKEPRGKIAYTIWTEDGHYQNERKAHRAALWVEVAARRNRRTIEMAERDEKRRNAPPVNQKLFEEITRYRITNPEAAYIPYDAIAAAFRAVHRKTGWLAEHLSKPDEDWTWSNGE